MYPSNPSRYPEFVADQVLTAQNLTDLFNYLDEESRLTRTNLIGIGIVCGLEAHTDAKSESIIITKGTGITSKGYLVSLSGDTYTHYSEFNAEKEHYYDRLVNPADKKQRFGLWELAKAGGTAAAKQLTPEFLKDKVVMVFVELLATGNKNCDPDSCDDKGITVDVKFRVLLVEEKNAKILVGPSKSELVQKKLVPCLQWPAIKMPRYNVPATTLPDTATIFKNYLQILNASFLKKVETALTQSYAGLQLLVAHDMPANPFSKLSDNLRFLHDGSISFEQLLMVQYYYDFLSDLLQAYDELRVVCSQYFSVCLPDEEAFPRHLLLGAAFETEEQYRHYFIPSPALAGSGNLVPKLRFLLHRLARMVNTLQIPPSLSVGNRRGRLNDIRITPSKLGALPISQKAIPYYYDVSKHPPLYEHWNYAKTRAGKGNTNLSYYAGQYNPQDEQVSKPLLYDLESYNFLRIEGHIGMPWQDALKKVLDTKKNYRLPFDVVALNGDFNSLLDFLRKGLTNIAETLADRADEWRKIICYFGDIEMQYDMQTAELRCTIGRVMQWLYGLPGSAGQDGGTNTTAPVSMLLRHYNATFVTKPGTLGFEFDQWYPTVRNQPYFPIETMMGTTNFSRIAIRTVHPFALMYYLEKIHEALPGSIVQANIETLRLRLSDASKIAEAIMQSIKQVGGDNNPMDNPETFMHLNAVIRICKGNLLLELYRNLLFRFYLFLANQSFAAYSAMHTGFQHKAGVPIGGTFIMVYHDAAALRNALGLTRKEALSIDSRKINELIGTAKRNISIKANETVNKVGSNFRDTTGLRSERADASFEAAGTTGNLTGIRDIKQAENKQYDSIKTLGLHYLDGIIEKRLSEDILDDKELLELILSIPDGTVIADFYLPYLCCSECPPMHFVVMDRKEPDPDEPGKISVEVPPGEFCNASRETFAIKLSPDPNANSKITGEGTEAAGNAFVFVPAKVNLGTSLQKEITIQYIHETQQAETKVVVFAAPQASFKLAPATSAANAISITQIKITGNKQRWLLNGVEFSDKPNQGVVDAGRNGEHKITLIVSNGPCNDAEHSETINIGRIEEPLANCTPINNLLVAYRRWNTTSNRVFTRFIQSYQSYNDVNVFFTEILPKLIRDGQGENIEAFANEASPEKISQWLENLQGLIFELKAVRPASLELFRILQGLLVFYACMQKDDIDRPKVPTEKAFEFMSSLIENWQQLTRDWTDADKKILETMIDSLQTELDKTLVTTPAKQVYIKALQTLIELLTKAHG